MLKYRFLNNINGESVYAYYPEGNENAPGKVAILGNKQGRVIEESKDDFSKYYAYHAIYGIDTTRETGTVAWY